MATETLKARLHLIAIEGIKQANRNNPFITKSEAFIFLNKTRSI